MTIKMHISRSLVAFFLLNAGFVFAGGFKSNIITTSQLTVTIPEDRFLKITNFTQQGGTDRGLLRKEALTAASSVSPMLAGARMFLPRLESILAPALIRKISRKSVTPQ